MSKIVLLLTTFLVVLTAHAEDTKPTPDKSMLRVSVTSQGWNFGLPWQRLNPGTRRGLGALLPGNRVLVTAELAQDAQYVELEIAGSGRKLVSKVEAVDYELNLATIVPAAEPGDFFDGFIPLEPDAKMKPKTEIEVWQFENNGAPVTSKLDLHRADVAGYFLEDSLFLIFQANGAVQYRAGTFTLPVVHEGKLAGMLIRYNSRDQVADIIPPQIIARFLDDAASMPYEGVPNFGAKTAQTLDPQLRKFYKLDGVEGGILITDTTPGFSAEKAGLKAGDVMVEINGHKVDSRGNYLNPDFGLLSSTYLLRDSARTGDTAKLKIIRDGQPHDIDCKLERRQPSDYLVDPYMFDRGPRYFILGGLLFQELTLNYLQMGGREWRDRAPFRLLYAQQNQEELMKQSRRKLVFLSGVIPAPGNVGYERLRQIIVTRVNDRVINDIKDLAEAVKSPLEGIHKIEFTDHPRLIHMDAAQSEQDNKEFLPARYRITRLERLE
jgi:hypothetical protein